ncbi:MAG TPA: hypothetical protein DCS93_30035 [Microscillaceae bacterium]|nr:hypothetical protein [Microscillaceae bacterium]
MYIPFDEMPAHARVWVYQADRTLTAAESNEMEQNLQRFVSQWTAHSKDLKASAKVFPDRFVVISVDENHHQASGCSIDASVHFVQELEKHYKLNLFVRTELAYLEGEIVKTAPVSKLKQQVAEGVIKADTQVFNNLVANMGELREKWQTEAQNSWLARYF